MRKTLLFSVVGLFMASPTLAGAGCGGAKSAHDGKASQTVASDEGQQTKDPSGQTKDEKS